MNTTKLNPGSIASYNLRPGNGVVTILVERERIDKIWKKKTGKANEKKNKEKSKKGKR